MQGTVAMEGGVVPREGLRNVGLVAHVDAGKTTTTEQMLFLAGRTRVVGSVDQGTAQTDWLQVERERGISVRMATTVLPWRGCAINLVDTPGHVDFVAEVERAFQVLDGAVLIVAAAEGVQSHTETLWQALRALRLPTLVFVNKMDRLGVDPPAVLADMAGLSDRLVVVQEPLGAGDGFRGVAGVAHEALCDRLADLDTAVVERYVEDGRVDAAFLHGRLAALVAAGEAFPVLFGAAKTGTGIGDLLDAVVRYLPAPREAPPEAATSAVVFKLDHDAVMGRLAYVRLFAGSLRTREVVHNVTQHEDGKITQIRKMYARHHEDTSALGSGDIAALCGLGSVRVGDVLGSADGVPPGVHLATPVLSVRVHPRAPADLPRLLEALQQLNDEDPLLDVQWLPEVRELHAKVMGAVQVEVLESLLGERFGLRAAFDPPTVIYRETPARGGEGFESYTWPKPCWAVLRFAIAPGPRGSGLVYASVVPANRLLPAYQREVERRVPQALQQGLLGWQVTDLTVTLIDGEHHVYHTHPLDWFVATPMALMNGLAQTGTILLEPLYGFRLSVPEEMAGRVMGDLLRMRAAWQPAQVQGGRVVVEGALPVAVSLDYAARLGMQTGGRAALSTWFGGYQPAPSDVRATRERVGVNPLDRARYILSVRGAI